MARMTRSLATLLVAILAVVSAEDAAATHTTFLYQVDRFEVSGNAPVSAVDEFDDGIIAPWTVVHGTADESDGVVSLQSPGFDHDVLTNIMPVILDRSDLYAPASFSVADGYGDFDAVATFVPLLPELPGGFMGLFLGWSVPGGPIVEGFGAYITNFSPAIAGHFGTTAGLAITQGAFTYNSATGYMEAVDVTGSSITPGDVTGPILLGLSFDDSADTLTASFSLDGGATTLTPFAPVASGLTSSLGANFSLVGDPATLVPEPSALVLLGSLVLATVLLLAAPRRSATA